MRNWIWKAHMKVELVFHAELSAHYHPFICWLQLLTPTEKRIIKKITIKVYRAGIRNQRWKEQIRNMKNNTARERARERGSGSHSVSHYPTFMVLHRQTLTAIKETTAPLPHTHTHARGCFPQLLSPHFETFQNMPVKRFERLTACPRPPRRWRGQIQYSYCAGRDATIS